MEEKDEKKIVKKVFIWRPISWVLISESENKLVPGDIIYRMKIGNKGEEPVYESISKNIFEKILKGKYLYQYVEADDFNKLIIINGNNEIFLPVMGVSLNEADLPDTIKSSPLVLKIKK